MSRVKKSRKSSSTVKAPSIENKSKTGKSASVKYSKKRDSGMSPGSRHNEVALGVASGGRPKNKDPRHGSKTKISLTPPVEKIEITLPVEQSITPTKISPEAELKLLEQDPKLMDLLDQLDNEQAISNTDQRWLDKKMKRHHQLLELLDLLDDDEHDQGDLGSYFE